MHMGSLHRLVFGVEKVMAQVKYLWEYWYTWQVSTGEKQPVVPDDQTSMTAGNIQVSHLAHLSTRWSILTKPVPCLHPLATRGWTWAPAAPFFPSLSPTTCTQTQGCKVAPGSRSVWSVWLSCTHGTSYTGYYFAAAATTDNWVQMGFSFLLGSNWNISRS